MFRLRYCWNRLFHPAVLSVACQRSEQAQTGVYGQGFALMKTRVLKNMDELDSVAQEWRKMLPAKGVTPTQEHIWYLSCAETLLGQSKLAVIAVEDNTGLLALAPLMMTSAFPHGYEQLGVGALYEPSNLLYMDESALDVLLGALLQTRQPLILGRTYADSRIFAAIQRAFAGKGIVITRNCSGLPYIKLDGSDSDIDTLLSGSLRSDLRRARRKADATGRVSFKVYTPASAREFLALFEDALKIEATGWKGRCGSDLVTDTTRQAFFRHYGIRAAEKGTLRLAFMFIDSEPVAMQFAVQTGGSFWLLKIGYNEAFSKCSPGMLLMLETLRFAAQQGLSSYEFLGCSEHWTRRWTRLERPSIRIEAYPFTARGVAAFGHRIARRAQRKAFRKFGYQS